MNIIQERIDDLNAVLKVNLSPGDYKKPLDEAIKKYSKSISLPGFRKGMVPPGLIRKMYGKALLADELNKLVADSINRYITENKIEILGNPLPKAENDYNIDLDKPSDIEFSFDMGLAPNIEVQLPPKHKFIQYEIEVSDADVDSEIDRLRRRHGKYINPEVSDAECSLYGTIAAIDSNGEPVEGGHRHQGFILIENVKDTDVKKSLTGLKKEDSIVFNPMTAMQNETDAKYLLGIKDENIPVDVPYRFTVERINKVTKAELDQELFDSVYGPGEVADEDAFRNKIKEEIAQSYRYESEHKLKYDMEDYFLDNLNVKLPDEFLKRWIRHSNEKISAEELEKDYNRYARDLKWRMIENKIFREQSMTVEKEDLDNYAKHYIMDQYVRYGQAHLLTDEKLAEMTDRFLANPDNIQHIIENITSRKVFDFMKNILEKEPRKISYDDFMQILREHVH